MYSTCLHCTRPLGANAVIETLPIGRRLAFDADKGRLWVVCRECAKWNLVPFDTRLESIEACERLYRDTATRYATANIGFAKVREGLELIRIGAPLRPELAAWRYGAGFARRRLTSWLQLGTIGAGVAGLYVWSQSGGFTGIASAAGAITIGVLNARTIVGSVRNRMERLRLRDPRSGRRIGIDAFWLRRSRIRTTGEGHFGVSIDWGESCFDYHDDEARHLSGRILASLNRFDASAERVDEATRLLADRGDWERLVRGITREPHVPLPEDRRGPPPTSHIAWHDVTFGALTPDVRFAMEMATHEESERRWLDGELAMLEREWREAEKLAKIADDLAVSRES